MVLDLGDGGLSVERAPLPQRTVWSCRKKWLRVIVFTVRSDPRMTCVSGSLEDTIPRRRVLELGITEVSEG